MGEAMKFSAGLTQPHLAARHTPGDGENSVDDTIARTLGRVLDLFDIDPGTVRRWTGDKARSKAPASK